MSKNFKVIIQIKGKKKKGIWIEGLLFSQGKIPTSVCGISDVIFTTFFSAALEKEERVI